MEYKYFDYIHTYIQTNKQMTNPLAIITLHATQFYHSIAGSAAASATSANNKSIAYYALGTTILATILYKSLYKNTTISKEKSNLINTITLPFTFFYSKLKSKKISSNQLEVLFENKYFDEYDEWLAKTNTSTETNENVIINVKEEEHKKECLENMYYSTVREKINDFYGEVIMCYDHATFSFAYYARTGNIPYKYLETISRKYMIETNAPREIHVDIRDEYKKAKDKTVVAATGPAHLKKDSSMDDGTSDEDDVFVKLKSYNTASNLNLHTTTNETKEKTHKFATASPSTSQELPSSTTKIIRDKANRYSYRGKLDDFEQHHNTFLADRRKAVTTTATTATTAATATSSTPSSYAEYKKQMMKTC